MTEIKSPTLLVDKKKCLENIRRMADKASRNNLLLRPHFKTHNSIQIGKWFRDFGIDGITVSSVAMARKFAQAGWDDITIAFPVNIREIDAINRLADQLESLCLLVVDADVIQFLRTNLSSNVRIYIEIDTGAARSGLLPSDHTGITNLINIIEESETMLFKGFYSHPGHSYSARSKEQIEVIHTDVLDKMASLKQEFSEARCCIGDTPCCSVAEQFDPVDEISPGNFVYYDLMQVAIGSCTVDQIAACLAAPVVAKYPNRKEIVLHGGAVHLSKESLDWDESRSYGVPVILQNDNWLHPEYDSFLNALSQEHGVLACSDELFHTIGVGDIIGILPVHSCLTANLMQGHYKIIE